jgi:hypothetical protein
MRDKLRRFVVVSCQKDGTYFNGFFTKINNSYGIEKFAVLTGLAVATVLKISLPAKLLVTYR